MAEDAQKGEAVPRSQAPSFSRNHEDQDESEPSEAEGGRWARIRKHAFDAYAMKENPATIAGIVVTLLVLAATVVYCVIVVYQTITGPLQQLVSFCTSCLRLDHMEV